MRLTKTYSEATLWTWILQKFKTFVCQLPSPLIKKIPEVSCVMPQYIKIKISLNKNNLWRFCHIDFSILISVQHRYPSRGLPHWTCHCLSPVPQLCLHVLRIITCTFIEPLKVDEMCYWNWIRRKTSFKSALHIQHKVLCDILGYWPKYLNKFDSKF